MGGRRAARRESAAARGGRGRRRHVAPAFGCVATPAAAAPCTRSGVRDHAQVEALMEAEYSEVVASCEARRDAPMEATLDTMHPLDPPPPDVLLALLARNKALEGRPHC
ncbi:hypothetical protein HF086_013439 [Spodoptera exigua]|uniref:Uncharacterized protein n=1 Tax=Spodoptera exigua TaxID=7107 RepID=A0A922MMZ3_SPOEX|nr:hypothetical protein HF086_013439 [Spodoptera exigua]